jgi:hypothetical protein
MTTLTTTEAYLVDNYFIDNDIKQFNIDTFNDAITQVIPWNRRLGMIDIGELGIARITPTYTEYVKTLLERDKLMKKITPPMNDMSLQIIIDLQEELTNAIENRDAYLCGPDWNMVKLWDEQIDYIIRELQYLGTNE